MKASLIILSSSSLTTTEECLVSWTFYANKCFKSVRKTISWSNSVSECESMIPEGVTRGTLASIRNDAENDFLANLAGADSWIGGSRQGDSWTWTDGSVFNYTNWNTGEPNNENGQEDSIMLHWDGTGVWNDAGRDWLLGGYICQYEPATTNTSTTSTTSATTTTSAPGTFDF